MLGFADEVWWSRFARPGLHAWTSEEPLHLAELTPDKDDPEPKALACYGLLRTDTQRVMLRFVDGRPVSDVTCQFLPWICQQLAKEGKTALLLVWDNASWHISKQVRAWIRAYNRQARAQGGVRIVVCQLPSKSPWLNPIEPRWVHGKRATAEPERQLSSQELKERIVAYYGCQLLPPISQQVDG